MLRVIKCNGENHHPRCSLKQSNSTEEMNGDNKTLEGLSLKEIQGSTRRNIYLDLLVKNIPMTFELDTECILASSMRLENELNARVEPTSMLLNSFGRAPLRHCGKCFLKGLTPG